MNPIVVTSFSGLAAAPNPRLLSESSAVEVVDAEPQQGNLRPLRGRTTVASVPASPQRKTIYRMGRDAPSDVNFWLSWTTLVDAVRMFDTEDTTERTAFTGSGSPKWTNTTLALTGGAPYPQAARELAIPAPTDVAILTLVTDGADGDEGTRFYVHTFVNELGWESAPSPVSAGITLHPAATVTISGLPAAPAGNYGITLRRIYRTQPGTGDGAASFYFLREVSIGTTSTMDDGRSLGEEIATVGWLAPPSDGHSLIGLWNGMLAMLSGKGVWFCEANAPYAWPLKYQQDLRDTPVATASWEQNLLVLTTGRSVLFQGADPAGMTEVPSFAGFPCASKRSVVSFAHGVVWATPEGLAYSGSVELLTQGIFRPEQWRGLNPGSMVASRWGRFYACSYDDPKSNVKKGFLIDPLRPVDGVWNLSAGWDAAWYDPIADAMYVLEGGNIRSFATATAMLQANWKSKVFHQLAPRNFAHAAVIADAYPVTFKLWSERIDPVTRVRTMPLRLTREVYGPAPFTLPSGFQSEDWQFQVATTDALQAVHLVNNIRQLREN